MDFFIKCLKGFDIDYVIESDGRIVITEENSTIIIGGGDITIKKSILPDNFTFNNNEIQIYLSELPENIHFNCEYIYVNNLSKTEMGSNIQFNNSGHVDLSNLNKMGDNNQFNNVGDVYLENLKTMGNNIQFNNRWRVYLRNLTTIGDVRFDCYDIYLGNLTDIPVRLRVLLTRSG